MNKTVVIHQPDLLPYLGFFHRFLHTDLWVILDNVQFVSGSRSWTNRDKIKTASGERWLTAAVQKAQGVRESKINEIILSSDVDWRKDNINLIVQNYDKAPFFDEIFLNIKSLYGYNCEKLVEFNLNSIDMLLKLFGIRIKTVLASDLRATGKKNELLVNLLKEVGGTTYLSGLGAKNYLDPQPFNNAGIQVVWQDFKHPVYPQLHGDFIPYLSSIDLLFNCGVEESRKILRRI